MRKVSHWIVDLIKSHNCHVLNCISIIFYPESCMEIHGSGYSFAGISAGKQRVQRLNCTWQLWHLRMKMLLLCLL
jgi:hypothetical protein